jgi:hypothetical protein
VVTGGHYDVDVVLTDPLKNVLYKEERQHIVIEKLKLIIFFANWTGNIMEVSSGIVRFGDS